MYNLYAPWRSSYFDSKVEGCVFCDVIKRFHEGDNLGVLFKNKNCFGIMNKYPYAPGHFMIIPNIHIDNIENLSEDIWLDMSKFVKLGVKILKEDFKVPAVNIGMNLGEFAGAGIPGHVHYHLVPRGKRDTNFITTIGDTRVNGVLFEDVYKKLKKAFDKYEIK